MNLVLDASVALCWLLQDGKPAARNYATTVLRVMQENDTTAIVPAIWGLEIGNVLAKAEYRKLISEAQSEAFLELLMELDIEIDAMTGARALTDILQLARRHRLSSYDASYLDIALRQSLPLATLDDDMNKAARKAGIARLTG